MAGGQRQAVADAATGPGGGWLRVLGAGIALFALASGVAAIAFAPPAVVVLRNVAFDAFQRAWPRAYVEAPVAIVDIDEESLARVGQWPWPRTRLAELVDRLREGGAAAIAFDVLLAEPDRTAPTELARLFADRPDLAGALATAPDPDRRLAEAMARAANVVLGFALDERAGGTERGPTTPGRVVSVGADALAALPSHSSAVAPLPVLEKTAAGIGSISFAAGADGVVRSVPLVYRVGNALLPSLVAEALRVATGAANLVVKSEPGADDAAASTQITALRIGALTVPADRHGELWLHVTPSLPARFIPAWEVLAGAVPPERIAGRVMFVGTSAKGLLDLRVSPLGAIVPGVELHAQIAEQILTGSMLLRPGWAAALEIVATIAAALALALTGSRLGAASSATIGAALIGALVVGSVVAFSRARLLLDPVTPSLTAGAVWLAVSVPRQLVIERTQRWVRSAFARYVSPNLVQHLLDNPRSLGLGGEWRACSFVMTDLVGFTTLLERHDPAAVVAVLNAYIEGMVEIAFRHQGTLDRIVGDAVAVIFGAPVDQPDHRERALACALEMDRFAGAFSAARQRDGIPLGGTRIGVHAGRVLVGNFGGSTMLDYRALGDAINTASRLESVNKQLGTRMCVSGEVARHVADFRGRPVGRLVLKGKSEAIEAFEPLDASVADIAGVAAYGEAFKLLEAEDPRALAAFRDACKRAPGDGLARFHLARLERGESGDTVRLADK